MIVLALSMAINCLIKYLTGGSVKVVKVLGVVYLLFMAVSYIN